MIHTMVELQLDDLTHKELQLRLKELQSALKLTQKRLVGYITAINKIEDYFEYRMESKRDQGVVHEILRGLSPSTVGSKVNTPLPQ